MSRKHFICVGGRPSSVFPGENFSLPGFWLQQA
jgi:hypothetical protein